MSRPLYVIEHWALAEPDAGRRHLIACGHDVRVIEPWRGEALPDLTGEEAGVMVMGGPQMVTDLADHPYLSDECRLIEQAMDNGVPLVGVCLGSQLVAHVLGADVGPLTDGSQCFGYYPTRSTGDGSGLLPERLVTLNGNAEHWSLPEGARLLAMGESETAPRQAFSYGETTIGLQFHPEVTRAILDQWQRDHGHLIGLPGTQSRAEQDEGFGRHDPALKAWYGRFLDIWFGPPAA